MKRNAVPINSHSPFSPPHTFHPFTHPLGKHQSLFLSLSLCLFWEFHTNRIIQYVLVVTDFFIMFSSYVLVAYICISFLLIAEWYHFVWIYLHSFIYPHIGYSLTIMNNPAMSICMSLFYCIICQT